MSDEALYEQGCDAADAGNHEEALGLFRRIDASRVPDALLALGNSLFALERYGEASVAYREAAFSGVREAWMNLGSSQYFVGRIRQARMAYTRAIQEGDTGGWYGLALIAWHCDHDLSAAEKFAQEGAQKGHPRSISLELAIKWESSHDVSLRDELERYCDQADEARMALAKLALFEGRREDALEILRAGVEQGSLDCCLVLGNELSRHGEYEEAKEIYGIGSRLGSVYCRHNLGMELLREGRAIEGASHLKSAARCGDYLSRRVLRRLRRQRII